MAEKKGSKKQEVTDILEITQGHVECCVLGHTPLVMNSMSAKVEHELLLPKGRKNAAERATTLKHNPVEEYRASVYRLKDETQPTYLAMPSPAFKRAICTAALDMPGMKKAQIGRLSRVTGEDVAVFGLPKLFMRVVRSADINRTPDIRTRAILPTWACRVSITFVEPLIRAQALANLLAAAGMTVGIGDGRQEKGALSYGLFTIVSPDDPEFVAVMQSGGRDAQIDGLNVPVCYDDHSAELLAWYEEEKARRQLKGVA